jgi:RNA polymerase sigma-54 factor
MIMAFRQDQNNSQKQKVSSSPQLIEAITSNEKFDIELQDEIDLAILTDADLEEASLKFGDDEGVLDVDQDGRVNEDIDWDTYVTKDDTNRIEREVRQKVLLPLEHVSSENTNDLNSHLISQLLFSKVNIVKKKIGAYIIGNLNEDGYLETPIEELWQENPSYELGTWRETLKLIQSFDPKGVAAKDLQECLLIQARSIKAKNSLVEKIIKYHWNDFLNKKCDAIAKRLSVPLYDVHAAYSVVSGFNARPGQRFNKKIYFNEEISAFKDAVFHIKPDFYISKNGNGYRIDPEHCYIDAIISDYFYKKFENGDPLTLMDIYEYSRKRREIKRFIKPIQERHRNIYMTIRSVVRLQKEFFDSGSYINLRPLIARDVAKEINLDESTVRRIRKNKYVDTPHGIFKLEFFFDPVGVSTLDGKKIASKVLKKLIKNIIKSENKVKPYVDQKIADILKKNYKIKILTRTVNHYRESMGILPARLRKWPC